MVELNGVKYEMIDRIERLGKEEDTGKVCYDIFMKDGTCQRMSLDFLKEVAPLNCYLGRRRKNTADAEIEKVEKKAAKIYRETLEVEPSNAQEQIKPRKNFKAFAAQDWRHVVLKSSKFQPFWATEDDEMRLKPIYSTMRPVIKDDVVDWENLKHCHKVGAGLSPSSRIIKFGQTLFMVLKEERDAYHEWQKSQGRGKVKAALEKPDFNLKR